MWAVLMAVVKAVLRCRRRCANGMRVKPVESPRGSRVWCGCRVEPLVTAARLGMLYYAGLLVRGAQLVWLGCAKLVSTMGQVMGSQYAAPKSVASQLLGLWRVEQMTVPQ